MSEYNGYPNYETWCVNLHFGEELKASFEFWSFDSLYAAQCHLREQVAEHIEEAIAKADNDYFISDLLWASLDEVDFRYLAELYLGEIETESESAA